MMDSLNENTHLQESLELLAKKTVRWEQRVAGTEGMENPLENANAGMK